MKWLWRAIVAVVLSLPEDFGSPGTEAEGVRLAGDRERPSPLEVPSEPALLAGSPPGAEDAAYLRVVALRRLGETDAVRLAAEQYLRRLSVRISPQRGRSALASRERQEHGRSSLPLLSFGT